MRSGPSTCTQASVQEAQTAQTAWAKKGPDTGQVQAQLPSPTPHGEPWQRRLSGTAGTVSVLGCHGPTGSPLAVAGVSLPTRLPRVPWGSLNPVTALPGADPLGPDLQAETETYWPGLQGIQKQIHQHKPGNEAWPKAAPGCLCGALESCHGVWERFAPRAAGGGQCPISPHLGGWVGSGEGCASRHTAPSWGSMAEGP